jgi:Protein of unknown function (DUF3306)
MSGGFFSRWSERKKAAEQGVPKSPATDFPTEATSNNLKAARGELVEPHLSVDKTSTNQNTLRQAQGERRVFSSSPENEVNKDVHLEGKIPESATQTGSLGTTANSQSLHAEVKPALPPIESLTTESDYKPFMAKDVLPETRNLAMKKLFTDPQFNVMDGLDVYIDDYGKPDPIPEAWYAQMNQMKMFRTEEEKRADAKADAEAEAEARAEEHIETTAQTSAVENETMAQTASTSAQEQSDVHGVPTETTEVNDAEAATEDNDAAAAAKIAAS